MLRITADAGYKGRIASRIAVLENLKPPDREIAHIGRAEDRRAHIPRRFCLREVEAHVLKAEVGQFESDLGNPGFTCRAGQINQSAEAAAVSVSCQPVEFQFIKIGTASLKINHARNQNVFARLPMLRHDLVPLVQIRDFPVVQMQAAVRLPILHHARQLAFPAALLGIAELQRVAIQRLGEGLGGNLNQRFFLLVVRLYCNLRVFACDRGVADIHTVKLNLQVLSDIVAAHARMRQLRGHIIDAVFILRVFDAENRVVLLSRQRDLLLRPALARAVAQQLRHAASVHRGIVPGGAQTYLIHPDIRCSERLTGQEFCRNRPAHILRQSAYLLPAVSVNIGVGAARIRGDTVGMRAGSGDIAKRDHIAKVIHGSPDTCRVVARSLQNVDIAAASAYKGGVTGGALPADAADIVSGGADGAMRIAVLRRTGRHIARQTANRVHDIGAGDLDVHVTRIALLDIRGRRVPDQRARVKRTLHAHIRNPAVRY